MGDIQQDNEKRIAYNWIIPYVILEQNKSLLLKYLSEIEPEYILDTIDMFVRLSVRCHAPEITTLLLDYKYKNNLFLDKRIELL